MRTGKRFGVIGAGPIGSILTAYLEASGHEVFLIDVERHRLDAIAEEGIEVIGVRELSQRCESLGYKIAELREHPVDVVLISVKAGHLEEVARELGEALRGDEAVCACQNGLDNELLLADHFGADRSLRMVINFAGNLRMDHKVDMTFFNEPNYVGAMTDAGIAIAQYLAVTLTGAGLDTATTSRIRRHEWRKTILNASLSAICALTNKTMRDVMSFEDTRALVSGFIREGIEVARADGIEFDPDFHDSCMAYLSAGGHHKPTMLIDLLTGRRTEIAWLNGRIVELAKRYGVDAPLNQALTSMVRLMET